MNGDLPEVVFREELRIEGTFSSVREKSVDVFCEIKRVKYSHNSEIKFKARSRIADDRSLTHLIRSGNLVLRGTLHRYFQVYAECVVLSAGDDFIEGIVKCIDIGDFTFSDQPERQTVLVRFTPCPIAEPEVTSLVRYWTGEIRPYREEDGNRDVNLDTDIGVASFSRHSVYEDAQVDNMVANVQVPVPTLSITVNEVDLTNNLHYLIERLTYFLGSLETLLSFLSRRQVRWVQIEVVTELGGEAGIKSARRLQTAYGSDLPPEPLVVPARLETSDLGSLMSAFQESQYQEPVEHAVHYLNSHWRPGFIEGKFGNAFIGFETLINGISSVDGSDTTLSQRMFKRLRGEIDRHIKRFAEENSISIECRKELYGKVGELQRRPIIPRALQLIELYAVPWRDLWPQGADLEVELRKAYSRRSKFMHTGKIDDYRAAIADAQRVHSLGERLIYNLVGAKRAWLHPAAYSSSNLLQRGS
nr:hypothetical protein [uncultured bacterium]